MSHRFLVICTVIAMSCCAGAQTGSAASTGNAGPAEPAFGPGAPYTEVLSPPLPVSSVRMPIGFSSETPRSNYLTGSIGLATAYDDNALSAGSGRVGDTSYMFFPTIALVQQRGLWNWDFGYSPGFTVNQRLSQRNEAAHNLHLLLGRRLSPHIYLQIHDMFDKTTTLFSDFLASGTPQPGPIQQPNTSLMIPLANRTANTSGLDLTYQFGRDSMVGASGGYYFINYDATAATAGTTAGLIDTRSWNGDAFYAHRFAGRHWLGATYNVQRLMFGGPRTDVQRGLVFYSISLRSHMSLSAWGGPERSTRLLPISPAQSNGPLSRTQRWDAAGGVAWAWQGPRTGLGIGYTRQTTDGGGLIDAVLMQSIQGELRRQLTARWTASLGVSYAMNDPLAAADASTLRTLLGSAGLGWAATDHLGFGFRYGRDQQRYADTRPRLSANRNRGWISMSYSFTRPLGR